MKKQPFGVQFFIYSTPPLPHIIKKHNDELLKLYSSGKTIIFIKCIAVVYFLNFVVTKILGGGEGFFHNMYILTLNNVPASRA